MNKVHSVQLHLNSLKMVYRAKIKQLGISLHCQTKCPTSVFTSFPKNSICDPSGIILIPHHCSEIKHLLETKTSNSKTSELPYVCFLREMSNTL